MKNHNKIIKIIIVIIELILPLVLSFLCQRLTIGRGYEPGITNPFSLITKYIFWGSVFILFLGIFKKNYLAIFFYLLFFTLFTLINRYKIKFLNQPLEITDLTVINQGVFNFISPILENTKFKLELMVSCIVLICSFFVFKKIDQILIKNIFIRLFLIFFSIFILGSSYFITPIFNQSLNLLNIKFNQWDSADNCRKNGILLCFVYNFQFLHSPKINNYNQNTINNIYQSIPTNYNLSASKIKPNIILILSESLWDVTKFKNNVFSKDPISQFRPDIKGNFISPAFGGETANVEFEILTGLNNYFFEKNSYPYTEFIKKNIPSLFTVFKDNGYTTTTIHPYSPWFYNRQNVYKHFGLDKFINLSNMKDYETAGPFVSAKSFTQEIIKQFKSTDQPQFIFAISIQNHAPYEANRFKNEQIDIKNNLSQQDNSVLQSYVEGINLSSQYYQVLKEEIKKSQKPTIIIAFGDHLPFLGNNFDLYKKLQFIPNNEQNWSEQDKFNMQSTPITIWSNFTKNIKPLEDISPAFISQKIFELSEIKPEYQFKLINQLYPDIKYLTKKIKPDTSSQSALLENYKLIQHDLLFGKQYTWNNK